MNTQRYREVDSEQSELTLDEMRRGWHFCPEWDEMLIGPGMDEYEYTCTCKLSPRNDEEYK